MAKYACSEEGVQALKNCANQIMEGGQTIRQETNAVRQVASEYTDTIGPHQVQLTTALDEIAGEVNKCIEPANNIADLLKEVAEGYQEIIDDTSGFGTSGN